MAPARTMQRQRSSSTAAAAFVLTLALCCGHAFASTPPTNLTAVLGDASEHGDYVNLKVQWVAASCLSGWPYYDVYLTAEGGKKVHMGGTYGTAMILTKVEYWTKFNVELDTSGCLFTTFDPLNQDINTGPGNPHKVSDVHPVPEKTSVNITITEAATMPRTVDIYNVTACNDQIGQCRNVRVPRKSPALKHHELESTVDTRLTGLVPHTRYNVSVVPLIFNKEEKTGKTKIYAGEEFRTQFTTKTIKYPTPDEFASNSSETGDSASVTVSWKLTPVDELTLAYFNLTLSDTEGHLLYSGSTNESSVVLDGLPFFAKLTLEVAPVFNFSGYLQPANAGDYIFTTPDAQIGPPRNFDYAALSPVSVLLGWDAPKNVSKLSVFYDVTHCLDSKCVTNSSIVGHRLPLDKLKANATYFVEITAMANTTEGHTIAGDTLNATFATLAKDWPAATRINGSVTNSSSSSAVGYKVTWSLDIDKNQKPPKEFDSFSVTICDQTDPADCSTINTGSKSELESSLGYFRDYTATVHANYALHLDVNITKNATDTLATPGTKPEPVTDITPSNVTAFEALLEWEEPANIPSGIGRRYMIADSDNGLTAECTEEKIALAKLVPYRRYNVSIETHVDYQNATWKSELAFMSFETDVATPGPVSHVEVEQDSESNVALVSWTPVAANETFGPINFYRVRSYYANGTLISDLKAPGTTRFQVTLPVADAANYTIGVKAVNLDNHTMELAGSETTAVLEFHGVAEPVNVTLVKRTGDSLTLEVLTQNTSSAPHLFFEYYVDSKDASNVSDTRQFTITGLTPYNNETVHVRACYSPTFCSPEFVEQFQTNVGAPSAVRHIVPSVFNRTNPVFTWKEPKVTNGPLGGYQVYLVDATNPDIKDNKTLKKSQTSYKFNTSEEFERYVVTVMAFNVDLDNDTNHVLGVAAESNCSTSGFSAPKPDVTEVEMNTTSLELAWEKPDYPGFNITWYRVVVPELKQDYLMQETSLRLDGLKPFTNISVQVHSCTEKKNEECGQARHYTGTTDASNPSVPRVLVTSSVNETTADLKWEAPETPNGKINGYKLALVETANKTANVTWAKLPGDQLSFPLHDLAKNTEYTVQLRAFNLNSLDDELDSDPASLKFTTTGGASSAGFPVWLIVVIVIVLVAVVVAGAFLYRRKRAQPDDTEHLVPA